MLLPGLFGYIELRVVLMEFQSLLLKCKNLSSSEFQFGGVLSFLFCLCQQLSSYNLQILLSVYPVVEKRDPEAELFVGSVESFCVLLSCSSFLLVIVFVVCLGVLVCSFFCGSVLFSLYLILKE